MYFQTVVTLLSLVVSFQSRSENIIFSNDTFPACNLPAPSELQIASFGTNWATLKWTAVPGATAYRVKASQLPGGIVDADVQTPATNINLTGLVSGGYYRFSVAAICPNGVPSDITKSELNTLIVLDIVLNARPPKNCNFEGITDECHHEPWQTNNLSATCWVRVSQGSAASFFQVKTVGGEGISTGQVNNWCSNPSEPAPPSLGALLTNDQGDFDPSSSLQFVQIVLSGTTLYQLNTWKAGDEIFICPVELVEGYTFAFLNEETGLTPSVAEEYSSNEGSKQTEALKLGVVENPFFDVLHCNLSVSNEAAISLSLFGQQGQMVFQQQFDLMPGSQSVGIRTEHLPPGVYYLTLESAREVRVLKLAKGP